MSCFNNNSTHIVAHFPKFGLIAFILFIAASQTLFAPQHSSAKPSMANASTWALLNDKRPLISFDDDFSTETRKQDDLHGDVGYDRSGATLKPGGQIERRLTTGNVAELRLKLEQFLPTDDAGSAELRIAFTFRSKRAMVVLLHQRKDNSVSREVCIVAGEAPEGHVRLRVVRHFPLAGDFGGEWVVRYNHGVIEALQDGGHIGAAELNFFNDTLDGVQFTALDGTCRCGRWQLHALPAPLESKAGNAAADKRAFTNFLDAANESERLFTAQRFAECIPATEKAIALSREQLGRSHSVTVQLMSRLASCQQGLGHFDEALKLHDETLKTTRKSVGDTHPDTARRLVDQAVCYNLMDDPRQSWNAYEKAISIFTDVLGDASNETAQALRGASLALQRLDRFDEAARYCRRARDSYLGREGADSLQAARATMQLAGLYQDQGDWDHAAKETHGAISTLSKQLGPDARETLAARVQLSANLRMAGRYTDAKREIEDVVARSRAAYGDDDPQTNFAVGELAKILAATGDLDLAGVHYSTAIPRLLKTPGENNAHVASMLADYGVFLMDRGQYPEADSYLSRSITALTKAFSASHSVTLSVMRQYALLKQARGELVEAETILQDALQREIKTHDELHPGVATTLSFLGEIAAQQSDSKKAVSYYERALAGLRRNYGDRNITTALVRRSFANVLWKSDRHDEALAADRESLQAIESLLGPSHPHTTISHVWLAEHLLQDRDWQAAQQQFIAGLAGEADYGFKFMQSLPESQALAYVERIYKARDELLQIVRVTRLYGSNALKLKSVPSATDADIYQSVWSTKALASRALARQRPAPEDRPEVASLWSELNNTRGALARLSLSTPKPAEASKYVKQFTQLTQQKEDLQRRLAEMHIESREDQATASNFYDLVHALPQGVAVVDLIRTDELNPVKGKESAGESQYEAFVLWNDPDNAQDFLRWVHLGPCGPIDEAVQTWQRTAGERGGNILTSSKETSGDWYSAGLTLRRLVWDPMALHLGGCRTIIVIPDGALARIPWTALPAKKPGRLLIDDYTFALAPYGQEVLLQLHQSPVKGKHVLLVGGVDYANTSAVGPSSETTNGNRRKVFWPRLPETLTEARAIKALAKSPDDVQLLRDRDATDTNVASAMSKSRYIHLATHGFFLPADANGAEKERSRATPAMDIGFDPLKLRSRNPLTRSGVVLAGNATVNSAPRNSDGILTAEEITGLDLHDTELVVLSACQTSLGDTPRGEGVFGLQRAFHEAGARSVVASLWSVDDAATRALMVESYKNLWEHKMGPAQALREAQLTMIHRYDSGFQRLRAGRGADSPEPSTTTEGKALPPYYWAAFVLSGDWQSDKTTRTGPAPDEKLTKGWRGFTSRSGGYYVWMPAQSKPTLTAETEPSPFGKLLVTNSRAKTNQNVELSVSWTDYPWDVSRTTTAEELLAAASKSLGNEVDGGKVEQSRSIDLDGIPGREVTIFGTTQCIRARMYLVEHRLFTVSATVPNKATLDQPAIEEFQNSFRLLN